MTYRSGSKGLRGQASSAWHGVVCLGLACALLASCGKDAGGGAPSWGYSTSGDRPPECGALNRVCLASGLDAPLAAGSYVELRLAFEQAGSSGPPTTLDSADPLVITIDEMTLTAEGPGASAVLFLGPDESVLDFIHVWVTEADELRIIRYSPAGEIMGRVHASGSLLQGDEVLVAVEPYANSQPLIGNFDLEWTVDGTAIAVVPDIVSGWYRTVAREVGDATVVFHGLGLQTTWQLEVMP